MNWTLTKLWAFCLKSATVAVAHVLTFGGILLAILTQLYGSQQLDQFISSVLPPERVPLTMSCIGIVVTIARMRTLWRK